MMIEFFAIWAFLTLISMTLIVFAHINPKEEPFIKQVTKLKKGDRTTASVIHDNQKN